MSIQILYTLEIFLRKSQLPQEVSLTTWFFHFFPVFPLPLKSFLLAIVQVISLIPYAFPLMNRIIILRKTQHKYQLNSSCRLVNIILYKSMSQSISRKDVYYSVRWNSSSFLSHSKGLSCYYMQYRGDNLSYMLLFATFTQSSQQRIGCSYYCPHSPDKRSRCSYIKQLAKAHKVST